jgi:hypothetical protein
MRFSWIVILLTACQSGSLIGKKVAGPSPAQTIANPNSASTSQAPAGADPNQLAQAQQAVATDNANEAADVAAFSSNGWKLVAPQIPDPDLLAFNPSLIADGRESDLRMQLASTTPKAADVPNIVAVAQQTDNADVRVQAVQALARVEAPAAQQGLLTLATSLAPDDDARQNCIAALRPPSVSDAFTAQVAALINDARLSAAEQQQIAFSLALVQARDQATITGLPAAAQAQVDAMTQLLRGVQ